MQSDRIPVFVFPHDITFVLEDKSTHKQVLTLYNPYEYRVKYRVLSTNPEKYIVGTPEGTIESRYRADIVIRHNDLKASNCDVVDKFRIQMQDKTTRQVIGKQDISSVLRSSLSGRVTPEIDNFRTIPASQLQSVISSNVPSTQGNVVVTQSPNYIILIIAVICIGGLFLPSEKDNAVSVQNGFHISVGLKLVLSYVLGLITMVILKP